MGLTFRKADFTFTREIVSLINSAYRGDSARLGWTNEADIVDGLRVDDEEVRTIIASPDRYFLLAFSGDTLQGCVLIQKEARGAYFGMLSVRPGLQNSGIGAAIMNEMESRVKADSAEYVRLSVIHVRKELISYYERKGYILTGLSGPFPPQYPAKIPGLLLLEMKKTL